MANVFQPRLLQVRTQYTKDPDTGDTPENILWFQSASAGTPTIANLQSMAAAFDPSWGSTWANVGPGAKHYLGSIWTDWSSDLGLQYSSVGTFVGTAGDLTGLCQAYQVAVLISMSNGQRFKGGHFRIYLPYIAATVATSGNEDTVQASYVTAVTTSFSALNGATTSSGVLGGQHQVLYRHRTNAALATLYPIVSFTVNSRFATQRRRLRKVPHR